ncbi:MAG TPA: IS91 family transposase [Chitinophagaceae bacterium]|nr:IS91 family transposase [Chitinophagaceae bacterium]
MSKATIGQQLQQLFDHSSIQGHNACSKNIFSRLHRCHTADMGMHFYCCDDESCHHIHQQYHSCGNRHCPNCGGLKKEEWIENLTAQLFPTSYYHVVFTAPHEFNALMLGNRKEMFTLLFEAASQTLLQFSQDEKYLGATCGITSVLHTWGQDLSFHPHLHCIVSGGGVKDKRWIEARRRNATFLFPVNAMKQVYKAIFLKKLRQLIAKGQLQTAGIAIEEVIKKAGYKSWNVYAKAPFGNVSSVVEYLGRYTHKVAITRHRILSITESEVTFRYKDYSDGNRQKEMTLSIAEFLRRFELHFLPRRYVKIRHYGFLQNHGRTTRLNAIRKEMQLQPLPPKVQIPVALRMLEQYGHDVSLCPKCKQGKLILVAIVYAGQRAVKLSAEVTTINKRVTLRNKASP